LDDDPVIDKVLFGTHDFFYLALRFPSHAVNPENQSGNRQGQGDQTPHSLKQVNLTVKN
jgi:hypothetical protein